MVQGHEALNILFFVLHFPNASALVDVVELRLSALEAPGRPPNPREVSASSVLHETTHRQK